MSFTLDYLLRFPGEKRTTRNIADRLMHVLLTAFVRNVVSEWNFYARK